MNDNDRLLNQIGLDLRMWRDDVHPPRITWIYTSSIIFAFLNAWGWMSLDTYWWIQCTAIFGGMLLFPFLFKKVFANMPGTWPEVLDKKLVRYKPLNIDAWQRLQATVTERKELSLDVTQRWYEAENIYRNERASGKSTGACHLQFLQNIPDSSCGKEWERER
ncbi:hypothetical protein BTO99_20925 [Salmonella enterica subsp. enterica serovar Bareilly]|uniref:Uncharacterized protein n=1 Tax=Salmonella enterica TaxID=28901 RepID=A0A402WM93_SALER|nr:hypothetical protein [Salmonella enterica]EBW8697261.1 hypothetical protein [Salmonella enterica subsp. diarizonae serovar 16:z10:e,n,x,z15]ECT8215874.1 hypothetical protein [Salmonella enterica subsp. enterica serovar Bareilly]EAS2063715.1 hypothetical protein [Salmonella enterica]EAS2070538.1 hypothetical protein [Salmonella enterica]